MPSSSSRRPNRNPAVTQQGSHSAALTPGSGNLGGRLNKSAPVRLPPSSFYDPLIEALIVKRNRLGINQRDLAAKIGCADDLVAKWEARMRYPRVYHLLIWAHALGIEIKAHDG
jgi:ribosome-binding protein aMBF1 (putative translation factor)